IRIDLDAKKGQFEELSRTIGRLSVPKLNSINRKANASFQGKFGEVLSGVSGKLKRLERWCQLGWDMLGAIVLDQHDIDMVQGILLTVGRSITSINNVKNGIEE
uniref:Uncharacterized protein n=1 Tax=Meloidogyne javanica TaxID=6303 RepID=A0A915LTW8_MELJA